MRKLTLLYIHVFKESREEISREAVLRTKNYNNVNFLQREPSFARRRARCKGWLNLQGKDVRNGDRKGREGYKGILIGTAVRRLGC